MKDFKKLSIKEPEKLLFGNAKNPQKLGLGIEVGNGEVVPELKYLLKPGMEEDLEKMREGYEKITKSALNRAVDVSFPSVQLETEFPEPLTLNEGWASEVINAQKSIMEEYHEEYGIRSALRATISDSRRYSRGIRDSDEIQKMLTAFEDAAKSGADLVSIESRGGQEVFQHSLIRNDLEGMVFGVGILGTADVHYLWNRISDAVNGRAVLGGDTACAFANSAMELANGYLEKKLPHVVPAVIRAISAVRSLGAFEAGAVGPDKDCAYEGIILKAITGCPISMEGKTSATAHSDFMGNLSAAACDLWSNETVEYGDMFGGKTTAVLLEMLGYDVSLMNQALENGEGLSLRNLMVKSDMYRDPQALVLTPESAVDIGRAIVSEDSQYRRCLAAAETASKILEENADSLGLDKTESKYLNKVKSILDDLPEEGSRFVERQTEKFVGKVDDFDPSNYKI